MRRMLALVLVAACGGAESPAADPAGPPTVVQPLLASAWCQEFGCTYDKSWPLKTGGDNHSIELAKWPNVLVDYASRDSVVSSAGLLVPTNAKPVPADVAPRFVAFAQVVAGECAGLAAHIERGVTQQRSGVMDATPLACGDWDVRAAQVGTSSVNLSIDRR